MVFLLVSIHKKHMLRNRRCNKHTRLQKHEIMQCGPLRSGMPKPPSAMDCERVGPKCLTCQSGFGPVMLRCPIHICVFLQTSYCQNGLLPFLISWKAGTVTKGTPICGPKTFVDVSSCAGLRTRAAKMGRWGTSWCPALRRSLPGCRPGDRSQEAMLRCCFKCMPDVGFVVLRRARCSPLRFWRWVR